MFCKNCGTKLPEGSEFCPACDTKIVEEVTFGHNSGTKEVYEGAAQQTTGTTTPICETQQRDGTVESMMAENTQSPSSADTAKAKKNATQRKVAKIGNILELVSLVLLFLSSFWNIPISPVILAVGVAVGLVLSTLGTKRPWGFIKTNKLIVGVILLVVFTVFALKFGGSDDKYIQMVKNGTLESYPQMTVGEAFDGYLNNPKWESGLSEDRQRFVNVKGGILYYEKDAEIVVQFFVNEKDDTFWYNACEVNGLPQNNADVLELFETIYEVKSLEEQNQATPVPAVTSNDVSTNNDTSTSNDVSTSSDATAYDEAAANNIFSKEEAIQIAIEHYSDTGCEAASCYSEDENYYYIRAFMSYDPETQKYSFVVGECMVAKYTGEVQEI